MKSVRFVSLKLLILWACIACVTANAATYPVCQGAAPACPVQSYASLNALFNSSVNLGAGDRVEVYASATPYASVIVPDDASGVDGNPLVIVGMASSSGARPVLQGGANTIEFRQSNHVVLQGFEIRGGSARCVYHSAHDITLRDNIIHNCAAHGVHSSDGLTGSLTLEYNEIFDAGTGETKHPIYVQSDETLFPNAVFHMRFNHVHDGNGGNLLKSRFARNEVYYNWFESSTFQEIELIGPDWYEQASSWSEDLVREDSDIVGNVIVHDSNWDIAVRMGGDLNGRNKGRIRLLNNTILFTSNNSNATAVRVQIGQETLEMHNNLMYQLSSTQTPTVITEGSADDEDVPWNDGRTWINGRKVRGSNNWVEVGSGLIPGANEWTVTTQGIEPEFTALNFSAGVVDLTPGPNSGLRDTGNANPSSPAGYEVSGALPLPLFHPPMRRKLNPGEEIARHITGNGIDIGAFERTGGSNSLLFKDGFE